MKPAPGWASPIGSRPQRLSYPFHQDARGSAFADPQAATRPQSSNFDEENGLFPLQLEEREETPRGRFRLGPTEFAPCHQSSDRNLFRVHDDAPKVAANTLTASPGQSWDTPTVVA